MNQDYFNELKSEDAQFDLEKYAKSLHVRECPLEYKGVYHSHVYSGDFSLWYVDVDGRGFGSHGMYQTTGAKTIRTAIRRAHRWIDFLIEESRPTKHEADGAETCDLYGCSKPAVVRLCESHYKPRKSCSICGQTDHVSSDCGLVLPNPPRR